MSLGDSDPVHLSRFTRRINFLRDLHSDSHVQFAQLTASSDFLFASRSRDFFISEGVNPVIFLN
jgi:hypothetical protein